MDKLLSEIESYWSTRAEGYSEVNHKELNGIQKEAWLKTLKRQFPEKKKEEPKKLATAKTEAHKLETKKEEPKKLATAKTEVHKLETKKEEPKKLATAIEEPKKLETAKTDPVPAPAAEIPASPEKTTPASKKAALRAAKKRGRSRNK